MQLQICDFISNEKTRSFGQIVIFYRKTGYLSQFFFNSKTLRQITEQRFFPIYLSNSFFGHLTVNMFLSFIWPNNLSQASLTYFTGPQTHTVSSTLFHQGYTPQFPCIRLYKRLVLGGLHLCAFETVLDLKTIQSCQYPGGLKLWDYSQLGVLAYVLD